MRSISANIMLAFILISQTFWFIGCTTHSEIRQLTHKVECDGKIVELNFQIDEDRLETNIPAQ